MLRTDFIISQTNLRAIAVENCLSLLDTDCTIPFIARYRKEKTGGLDEVEIGQIVKAEKDFSQLEKRKLSILKQLGDQGVNNPALDKEISAATSLSTLEDLYLPYKKKRSTKADEARSKGLEPLSKIILTKPKPYVLQEIKRLAKGSLSKEEIVLGAQHILAERFAERIGFRIRLRKSIEGGELYSKKSSKALSEEKTQVYRDYFDWKEPLSRMPSHRMLAITRGSNEGVLRVKIQIEDKRIILKMCEQIGRGKDLDMSLIEPAVKDAYKRLLFPAIEKEVLKSAKEKADQTAIKVFSGNLEQLLLASPLGEKRILALDPGFRTGCKLACIDAQGSPLYSDTIYPNPPQNQIQKSGSLIRELADRFDIEAIAIGNGTASRETSNFVKNLKLGEDIQIFTVNESGASIYSASDIARAEFPDYDITIRGAISIARRLADPLAELVKIDAKSIGVGQYQHEVDQVKLKEELDRVVESCVNKVGVNLNTASYSLLTYVSGIGPKLAEKIVAYRSENGNFSNRKELKNVPRLGSKAYEQSAAFLRIEGSSNPLDNSGIHPESYYAVQKMAKHLKTPIETILGNKELLDSLVLEDYTDDRLGLPSLLDIQKELNKPGRDPRSKAESFSFDPNIKDISDLREGLVLKGLVNNITNFGCFVDIGIKQSGLVHISRLSNNFVSDINQVVKLGDIVSVKIIEVDSLRKRVQLAMDF